MSMIDVTKDLPRSGDGLPMEWINAPFGPFFPGLPGGLLLTLTLDGDTVAESDARSLIENRALLQHSSMDS
ncbi:MAG TPA: NADH-quinone oxidoreductase subunit D, partial [Gammaproteobacteria bacterium]|nr:NADH-quinone oxidoreductase subunit D [Gammaproteobacteria bacterium]